jgi:hypothetical protein
MGHTHVDTNLWLSQHVAQVRQQLQVRDRELTVIESLDQLMPLAELSARFKLLAS